MNTTNTFLSRFKMHLAIIIVTSEWFKHKSQIGGGPSARVFDLPEGLCFQEYQKDPIQREDFDNQTIIEEEEPDTEIDDGIGPG